MNAVTPNLDAEYIRGQQVAGWERVKARTTKASAKAYCDKQIIRLGGHADYVVLEQPADVEGQAAA